MIRSLHAGSRQTGGFSLNALSDDELEDIHPATLEVLQKTGVFVGDDEAMQIYEGAGAVVDRKTRVVKIPALVVEEAIQSVPSKFIACGRTPKNDVVLERNQVTFTNFGEGICKGGQGLISDYRLT
jgi:trimethylamine--corrinoid protein Co-methyltransferase